MSEPQLNLFTDLFLPRFPSTRYQGSKRKILPELAQAFRSLEFTSVLDLFSGSGMVTLLLRHLAKQVDSNDFQLYNQTTARVLLSAAHEAIGSSV